MASFAACRQPDAREVGWLSFAPSKCFIRHMGSGRAPAQDFPWILWPRPRARAPMGVLYMRLLILPSTAEHIVCDSLSQDSPLCTRQVAAATAPGGGT